MLKRRTKKANMEMPTMAPVFIVRFVRWWVDRTLYGVGAMLSSDGVECRMELETEERCLWARAGMAIQKKTKMAAEWRIKVGEHEVSITQLR